MLLIDVHAFVCLCLACIRMSLSHVSSVYVGATMSLCIIPHSSLCPLDPTNYQPHHQVQLPPDEAVVLITTYSMLAYTGKRNDEARSFYVVCGICVATRFYPSSTHPLQATPGCSRTILHQKWQRKTGEGDSGPDQGPRVGAHDPRRGARRARQVSNTNE